MINISAAEARSRTQMGKERISASKEKLYDYLVRHNEKIKTKLETNIIDASDRGMSSTKITLYDFLPLVGNWYLNADQQMEVIKKVVETSLCDTHYVSSTFETTLTINW